MTHTKPNAELAYRVLDQIDAHPEQWDQGNWLGETDCGTSACFAGWAVLLAGHAVEMDEEGEDGWRPVAAIDGTDALVSEIAVADLRIAGVRSNCSLCGDDACGVTEAASSKLFHPGNTREQLGGLVEEIFGPRPAVAP